jgi:zinc transport system substrate-binding protein
VVGNAATPNVVPDIPGAKTVMLDNFPGADLDLIQVFQHNAQSLISALKG